MSLAYHWAAVITVLVSTYMEVVRRYIVVMFTYVVWLRVQEKLPELRRKTAELKAEVAVTLHVVITFFTYPALHHLLPACLEHPFTVLSSLCLSV